MITFDLMTLPDEPETPEVDLLAEAEGAAELLAPRAVADSLDSIARSIRRLVSLSEDHARDDGHDDRIQSLREELYDLDVKAAVMGELIEEIQGIVKPSTSKVSLEVKAAIDRWAAPVVEPEPETAVDMSPGFAMAVDEPDKGSPVVEVLEQPAHDADVEEWRQFARDSGHDWPDIAYANRSMIRTRLGIEQPVGEA